MTNNSFSVAPVMGLIVVLSLSSCATLNPAGQYQSGHSGSQVSQTLLRRKKRPQSQPAERQCFEPALWIVPENSDSNWLTVSLQQPDIKQSGIRHSVSGGYTYAFDRCLDRETTSLSSDAEFPCVTEPDDRFAPTCNDRNLWYRIVEDHQNFYSPANFAFLGIGFGIGAGISNTQLDREIYDHFNSSIRDAPSGEWLERFHTPKELGNGMYTLPAFALAWGIGSYYDDTPVGHFSSQWGERSLRSFLVGAPPVMLMQKVTGGGRPEEGGSHWHFWQDNNGVSGHSFMGALPFMTAAQALDEPVPKALLYAASTAVPLSRVTDGDHYASQAILGWWMALAATMAVDATVDDNSQWKVAPLPVPGYQGICFERRW